MTFLGIIENQSCETLLIVEIQLFSSPRQFRVVRQSWPLHVKHYFPFGVLLLDSVEQKKRSTEVTIGYRHGMTSESFRIARIHDNLFLLYLNLLIECQIPI